MLRELVILVDTLEEASIKHLQSTLLPEFGDLIALQSLDSGPCHIGLCAIHRQPNGRDVQLKVLQRPGPFDLREFYLASQKLHASASSGVSEPLKTGLALKSLVSHLASRKLPQPLQTTICLLGHVFFYEGFRRAITTASKSSMRLQFVALANPELGGQAMSEADRTTFLTDIADADNATASFIPNDPVSLQQLALQWLRDFVLPPPVLVALQLPTATLHCAALSQVLPLAGDVASARQCACHHLPLRDCTEHVGTCAATGKLLQPHEITADIHTVAVGRRTRLSFPPGAAVPPLRVRQQAELPGGGGASEEQQAAQLLCCVRQVKVEELSEGLMFGRPHLLMPNADALADFEAMEENEEDVAALCQVLRDGRSGLLLAGCADLDANATSAFTCFYTARPALDCSALLVRRIASAEELLPAVSALPPLCEPSDAAVSAAKAQLEALDAASGSRASDLFSPLDHFCGCHGVLQPLLQHSLPPAARAAAPAATGQRTPLGPQGLGDGQPQAHLLAQQQPQRQQLPAQPHAGVGHPNGRQVGDGAQNAAAAQLGSHLQRLRLPPDNAITGGLRPASSPSAADCGRNSAAQLQQRNNSSGGHRCAGNSAATVCRAPLGRRQPAQPKGSAAAPQLADELQDWHDDDIQQQPAIVRFAVVPPATKKRAGRQRNSGGAAAGKSDLPLKRLKRGM